MPASLRARRNPLPMTPLPWMMFPPLCARTIMLISSTLKKKMAQISSVKKKEREGLLNEANALVATLENTVIKKNKKKNVKNRKRRGRQRRGWFG